MNPEDLEQRLARQPFRELPEEWRDGILAAACAELPATPIGPRSAWPAWGPLLREIFWPAPRLWAAIACSWAVMLALAAVSAPPGGPPEPAGPSLGWSLRQQQKLLVELGSPLGVEKTDDRPGREALPGQPHSELNPGTDRG